MHYRLRQIIRQLILESQQDSNYKMIFLAGLPGGGKSTLLRHLNIEDKFTNCNIDNFFEPRLMSSLGTKDLNTFSERFFELRSIRDERALTAEELTDYERVKALRGKERRLFIDSINKFKQQVDDVCTIGSNFIIDGTAANYKMITDQAEKFRTLGYDCAMIFVDIDVETSVERNIKRGEEGGRAIYSQIIRDQGDRLPGHLGPYSEFFGPGRFFHVENKGTFEEYKENIDEIRPAVEQFMASPSAGDTL